MSAVNFVLKFFSFVLTISLKIIIVLHVLNSNTKGDCINSNDCGWCGLCVDKKPSGTKCFNPFPYTFNKEKECTYSPPTCSADVCNNHGNCFHDLGIMVPICVCNPDTNFIGQYCNKKVEERSKYDIAPLVAFNGNVSQPNLNYALNVYVYTIMKHNKHLEFYLTTSEGYRIRFNKATDCQDLKHITLHPYKLSSLPTAPQYGWTTALCKDVFPVKALFPYKFNLMPHMLTREGKLIGYIANISIVAASNGIVVFDYNYPVMVSYEDYGMDVKRFAPDVEITSCLENSPQGEQYYYRRSRIRLEGRVKNKLSPKEVVKWSIWDVNELRSEYSDPILYQINQGYSWTIKPFKLKFGFYRVELNVQNIFERNVMSNFAECYFEIKRENLRPIISGGNKKSVVKGEDLILSGLKSIDPNEPRKCYRLDFNWQCKPDCDNLIRESTKRYGTLSIPSHLLKPNKKYIFSLKIKVPGKPFTATSVQEVYVLNEDNVLAKGISIYCIVNCLTKVIPIDTLLIGVKTVEGEKVASRSTFNWTYYENYDLKGTVKNIQCSDYQYTSDLLCIPPNTLKEGTHYKFKAQAQVGNTDMTLSATFEVFVGKKPTGGYCNVSPKRGIQSQTPFSISCSGFIDNDSYLIFEFFNKYKSETDVSFSGRMLSTNNVGFLSDIKLTREIVLVYIYNKYGIVTQSKHEIDLIPHDTTVEEIETVFVKTDALVNACEINLALQELSRIPDLISKDMDKPYIAKKILSCTCILPYSNKIDMKEHLSTLKNLLTSLTSDKHFKIKQNMLKRSSHILNILSKTYRDTQTVSDFNIPYITIDMMKQLTVAFLDVIDILLTNRDESFLTSTEEELSLLEFQDGQDASRNIHDLLKNIAYTLSFRQGEGYKKCDFISTSNSSSITVLSDSPGRLITKVNSDPSIPVSLQLSEKTCQLQKLTFQVTLLKNDPFWPRRQNISTELINVSLYGNRSSDEEIKSLPKVIHSVKSINLSFKEVKVTSGMVTGVITQFNDKTVAMEDLDNKVRVIRLDIPKQSRLFLSVYVHSPNAQIKICFSDFLRPDYELVNNSNILVTALNSPYSLPSYLYPKERKELEYVYVGILPVSNASSNDSISYTINFHFNLCLTYVRYKWLSEFCEPEDTTNNGTVSCRCHHLSFFSALFAVPPNEVDPFNDISLFLTVTDNWTVTLFLSCFLSAFFILSIWARRSDVKDKAKREVIILEDNFPVDANVYLLGVFTGCRLNAGTSANVGIQIYGFDSVSHSHILRSSSHKVLKFNSEDWFLILTDRYLGVINYIHIWHDNSGSCPDWHCDKIVLVDLKPLVVYTFFVEQWLSLDVNEYSEAVLFPATTRELKSVGRIILENIMFGFQNSDLCGSILVRNSRSRIERLDRVIILLSFSMIAMVISIAFYKKSIHTVGIDDCEYTLGTVELVIGIQTFIVSTFLTLIVVLTFTRAYSSKNELKEHSSSTYARPEDRNNLTDKSSHLELYLQADPITRRKASFYQRTVKTLRKTFHPIPFVPVTVSKFPTKAPVDKKVYLLAWAVSLCIISTSAYFVTLYGLKLEANESKRWLSSTLLAIVQQMAIVSPIKIVLVAIILSTTYERFVQFPNCGIVVKDFFRVHQVRDCMNYSTLIKQKKHAMYKPMSVLASNVLRKKRQKQHDFYDLFELVMLIIYTIVLCVVIKGFSISRIQSDANFHAEKMMLFSLNPSEINFYDIINNEQFSDYLEKNFVNSLYNLKWYNQMSLNHTNLQVGPLGKFWVKDSIMKLVGSPVFRQLRVTPVGKCRVNKMFQNYVRGCIPNWSRKTEDRDKYGFQWSDDVDESTFKSNAWYYVTSTKTGWLSRDGKTRTLYHGGGYIVRLSSNRQEAEEILAMLREGQWINQYTRATVIVFTIFNVNRHSFTEVVLIAEHLPYQFYLTKTMFTTVTLETAYTTWASEFFLFVSITLFYILRVFGQINRKGFKSYFSKFMQIYHVIWLILGVLAVVFLIVHLEISQNYVEQFHKQSFDGFFEFDHLTRYEDVSNDLLTVLFCGLMIHIFSMCSFWGGQIRLYQTLISSSLALLCVLILTAFLLLFIQLVSSHFNVEFTFSTFYWLWSKQVYKSEQITGLFMLIFLGFAQKFLISNLFITFYYNYVCSKSTKQKRVALQNIIKRLKPKK